MTTAPNFTLGEVVRLRQGTSAKGMVIGGWQSGSRDDAVVLFEDGTLSTRSCREYVSCGETFDTHLGQAPGKWTVYERNPDGSWGKDSHDAQAQARKHFDTAKRDTVAILQARAGEVAAAHGRLDLPRMPNGAALSAFLGALIGMLPGALIMSYPLMALGSGVGGAVGGYVGAPEPRKAQASVGGGVGGFIATPLGAALGGWVGGDRRRNPRRMKNGTPAEHAKAAKAAKGEVERLLAASRRFMQQGNAVSALNNIAAAEYELGKLSVHMRYAKPQDVREVDLFDLMQIQQVHRRDLARMIGSRSQNPGPDPVTTAETDGKRALAASERALQAAKAGRLQEAVENLGATAYYVGACEAHLLHDPHGDHTEMYIKTVGKAAMNGMQTAEVLRQKTRGLGALKLLANPQRSRSIVTPWRRFS